MHVVLPGIPARAIQYPAIQQAQLRDLAELRRHRLATKHRARPQIVEHP